jgi:Glycosyl hydrolases family 28
LRIGDTNIPTYPLNTDGIDPSGSNIIIRNLTITCHDDAVAVKPMH